MHEIVVTQQAEDRAGRRYRIEVRVNPEKDALIRWAAEIEHATVTTFVLETATARAKPVVQELDKLPKWCPIS